MHIEEVAQKIVNTAIKVHTALGPGLKVGFLLNWNSLRMKDGIKRTVNKPVDRTIEPRWRKGREEGKIKSQAISFLVLLNVSQ